MVWRPRTGLRRGDGKLCFDFLVILLYSDTYMRLKSASVGTVGLGRRVREAREIRGFTQLELASHVGCRQPLITSIERGRKTNPRISTALGLARALGIPVAHLIAPDDVNQSAADAEFQRGRAFVLGWVERLLARWEIGEAVPPFDDRDLARIQVRLEALLRHGQEAMIRVAVRRTHRFLRRRWKRSGEVRRRATVRLRAHLLGEAEDRGFEVVSRLKAKSVKAGFRSRKLTGEALPRAKKKEKRAT